ncbi:MAG: hypothetical protein KC800_31385 [Candidatus Eremiobacteraeota bacterium]|nr:hypothetical protein [Candidatus Eremiobacteraeota bacterium]
MKPFLQLMALLTALTSGLTFVVGVVNKLFNWNLGLGIGGFDIDLPQDFVSTMAVAALLLILAGFFELIANFRHIVSKIKARPLPFAAAFLLLLGLTASGLYNLVGGALGVAVEANDAEKVRALLSETKYSQEDLGDHLYQTLRNQQLEVATALLQGGADVNRVSGEFETPLLTSACIYFPRESVFWLLENGADPNLQDNLGRTPAFNLLQYRSGHFPSESEEDTVAMLKTLKQAGADFDIPSDDGKSARSLASEKGKTQIEAFFQGLEG